ncbi:MAG: hypothetical protein DIU78_006060 [Pseudomonadota bacterium]|nr:MAG: hypothetical protein DIU78_06300 [Pseudomonadota bacterium]
MTVDDSPTNALFAASPFGLLLPGAIGALFVAWGLGRLVFPEASFRKRALGGLVLALAVFTAGMQALLHAGALRRGVLLALFVASISGVAVAVVRKARERRTVENAPKDAEAGAEQSASVGRGLDEGPSAARNAVSGAGGASACAGKGSVELTRVERRSVERIGAPGLRGVSRELRRVVRDPWVVVFVLIAAFALGTACLAAYLLPIWQWDALGYHLPFVNFVLQGGGLAELPRDVPYLSTYPRNVALLFAALRSLLPDDRLLDLGQIFFGLIGAAAVSGIARELGARRPDALVAGAAWLLVPAVFLQLPTNYIDVGVAAYFLLAAFFVLCSPTRATVLLSGLALGLFLGTKPNAPPAAALLGVVILVRAVRAGYVGSGILALLLSGAVGLEAYLVQLVRHGNPIWPVIVELGPLRLDGTISVEELLSSGAHTERVHGPLLSRVLRSWSSFDSTPVFDMRVGGLGPAFWLALPCAVVAVVRRRLGVFAALLAISVVTPDPAVVRYVLPFPGLVLAGAAVIVSGAPRAARHLAYGPLALASAWSLKYALPGLSGEGPPLLAYLGMSWAEREAAVGADGSPRAFVEARRRLAPGDVVLYDRSLNLPYLTWRSDAKNRVVRVPDDADPATVARLLRTTRARLVVAGKDEPTFRVVSARKDDFVPLFECRERCSVFLRR